MKIHGVYLNPHGDMVVQSYLQHGKFELASMHLWQRVTFRPGAVAIDVGAYTGLYGIAAAMAGATVYAFEPNPANYLRLVENLSANEHKGRMSVFHCAVGREISKGTLWDIKGRPPLTSAGKVTPMEVGDVDVTTIDALNVPRCDIIKIDVEGMELAVLRGAAETIAGNLPALIVEANNEEQRYAIDAELAQYGYGKGFRVDARNLIYVYPDR